MLTATAVPRGHFGRYPEGREASRAGEKVSLQPHIHKTKFACIKYHHKVISTPNKVEAILFLIGAPNYSYMSPVMGYSEASNTFPTGLKDEPLLSRAEALPQSRCTVYIF